VPMSQNAVVPILLAMELGVGSMEMVDLMSGAQKKPEYLAINPRGKVPGMVDGDVRIGESNAIIRYLALRYKPALYPVNDKASCYSIDFAIEAFTNKIYPEHVKVVYPVMGFGPPPEDQAAANKKLAEETATWFKDHVQGKFVMGNQLSIADFKAIPFLFSQVQPNVKRNSGFTAAARVAKYCEDFCSAVKASGFLKSGGGYSIAEFIASKTDAKPMPATPSVEIAGTSTRSSGLPAGAGNVKVYGAPMSQNCIGPIMLAMATQAGKMQMVDVMNGGLKTAEYLAVNPKGQMPGMEDGTVRGGESLAILRYLGISYSGGKLYPYAKPEAAAKIDFAMEDFCANVYEAHVGVIYATMGFIGMPDDKASAASKYNEAMESWAAIHLKGPGKYVLGDTLSIADYKAVPFFFAAVQPGALKKFPTLKPPARIRKYVEDFCAEVPAHDFMKNAGGYSLAEFITMKTS